jgi:hypothetical protein
MAKSSFKKKLHYVLLHYLDLMHFILFFYKSNHGWVPFPNWFSFWCSFKVWAWLYSLVKISKCLILFERWFVICDVFLLPFIFLSDHSIDYDWEGWMFVSRTTKTSAFWPRCPISPSFVELVMVSTILASRNVYICVWVEPNSLS